MRGPFWLTDEIVFPHPSLANKDGLLALGGDLSPERLLTAYACGIFPWFDEHSPILWWAPDPRFVLYPQELYVGRTLRQRIRSGRFEVRLDTAFEQVIRSCAATPRRGSYSTWITEEMIQAYCTLHSLGFAHSAESWRDGELVGGLYGVSMGSAYFGESMFFKESDASKVAFVALVRAMESWGIGLIDCQMPTEHLRRFGARNIPRDSFLTELSTRLDDPTHRGVWQLGET
ncbi:MAG: leucyl/phenylalanyl-tRNA--protein transferase [Myxococcota bacterium]